MIFCRLGVLLIALGLAACSDESTGPTEGGLTPEATALATQLRASGLAVQAGGDVDQPFFPVKGQILAAGPEQIQVFTFASPETAASAAATVSADGSQIGTSIVSWVAPPHFFRSGKLIVLYVGRDAPTLAALRTTLGAQFAGAA